MKKNAFSLMLMSLVVLSLFSCSKDDEDFDVQAGIQGKWTMESAELLIDGKTMAQYAKEAGLPEDSFDDFNFFSEFDKETSFDFQEGGVLIIKDSDGEKKNLWTADKKTLTVSEGDDNTVFTVRSLSGNTAVLSYKDETHVYGDFNIESMMTLKK